jgi:arginyl-tRNA synthetase
MGWDVVKINYLGDWGKQMGLLGVGWEKFGSEERFRADPIRHMLSVYRKIDELLRPELASRKMARDDGKDNFDLEIQGVSVERNAFFKRTEDGDKEALALCRRFRDVSIDYYTKLYASLNVSFDEYSGESQVSLETMAEVEEMLKSKGFSEESDGAWIVDLRKHGEEKGSPGTVIIRDRKGSSTYLLRDLAAAIDRSRKYSFDKMIYVVSDDHKLHFQRLVKILDLLNMSDLRHKLEHVSFINLPHMGHGDILNQCQNSMQKSLKKNPDKATLLGESEYPAAALGISALLAHELLVKRATDYDFNFSEMTSFKGSTGPNLQYWYLRLCSMLKVTSFDLSDFSDEDFTPFEEKYSDLLRILAKYPEITGSVYKTLEPRSVLLYLAKITDLLSYCIETEKGPEEWRPIPAEAALFESTRQVLENGMKLLGIKPDGVHPDQLSDIDSDTTDISSDMESVLSIVAPTVSSKTSIQGEISLFAADEFITLLLEDEELRVLFAAAIQSDRVGPERFERNLRRLLNQYSVDLKEEAERNEEKAAVYLIRSRSRYLANDIRRKLTSVKDSDRQYEILTQRSDHKINSLRAVERYLAESNSKGSNQRRPDNFLSEDSGNEAESSEKLREGDNSDSDFEENSADDDITESQNYEKLPKLSMVKDFMITSTAFSAFRENLRQFIQPTSRSKLGRLLAKISKPERNNSILESSKSKLRSLIRDLDFISPGQIRISYQESSGILNHLKGIVEELTEETWEWWPLKPRLRPLSPGHARLRWDCVSFRPLETGEYTNGRSPVAKNARKMFPHMLQDELSVFHSKTLPRRTCITLPIHKH